MQTWFQHSTFVSTQCLHADAYPTPTTDSTECFCLSWSVKYVVSTVCRWRTTTYSTIHAHAHSHLSCRGEKLDTCEQLRSCEALPWCFLLFSCTFDFDSSSPCKAFVSQGKLWIQSQRAQGHILLSRVSILNLAGTCDSFFSVVSMLLNGWRATDRVEGTTHTPRDSATRRCVMFSRPSTLRLGRPNWWRAATF